MNILAIDTSMQACSAAVVKADDSTHIHSIYEEIERGHAERLMAMVDDALGQAGLSIKQIDHFAVSRGPGTFTGVRIGIATARGLALALDKPLTGVGTLEILAARALFDHPQLATDQSRDIGIAVDARRGELYWQLFDGLGHPLAEPQALTPKAAADLVSERGKPVTLVGSGAELISSLLQSSNAVFTCISGALQPDAARLAQIITARKQADLASQSSVSPIYLRPADAKVQSGYAIERQ